MKQNIHSNDPSLRSTLAKYVALVKDIHHQLDVETTLRILRQSECLKPYSILVLMELKNLSWTEAKHIVHMSATWSDVREAHERLQNEFFDALQQLSDDDRAV